jgi:hypothetical protein
MPLHSPSIYSSNGGGAVIIAKRPMTMEEIIGFNAMAQLDEQDQLDRVRVNDRFCDEKDKVLRYGQNVTYNGTKVPC